MGGAHTCFVLGGEKEGQRGAPSAQPQLRIPEVFLEHPHHKAPPAAQNEHSGAGRREQMVEEPRIRGTFKVFLSFGLFCLSEVSPPATPG